MLERPRLRDASRPTRAPADFAEHLANLEAAGLLVRIDRPRSTRTPSCIRWCAGSSSAASTEDGPARLPVHQRGRAPRAAATTCRSRSARSAASAEIYAVGMGRPVEEIGAAWSDAIAHPIAPVAVDNPPCQEVVITGDDLRRARRRPVAAAGAGLDAGLRCRALSHRDAVRHASIRTPACATWAPIAPRSKPPTGSGCAWRRAIGGAGGYLHWQKYRARKQPMPCAIVVGCAPVVAFTGPQKLAIDLDEMAVAGALAGHPIRTAKCVTLDLEVPADAEIVDRGPDRSRPVRARGSVRRKPRLRGARGLQHVDAGHRDHPSARAGVCVDHQPGDAARIERDQARRLRADVPLPPARPAVDQRHPPRRPARAARAICGR